MSAPQTPSPMNAPFQANWVRWIGSALLLLVTMLAYQDIRLNGFHFDDWPNILDNKAVQLTEFSLRGLVDAADGAFLPTRPVPSATFALDWLLGGGAASAFLWTNLALHIATAFAVAFLIIRTLAAKTQATAPLVLMAGFAAALWWAVQPIHVQAVSYAVQRMTELAALFTALSVGAWLAARRSADSLRAALWYLVSAVSFALGALSKENAWITPALLLLAEYLVLREAGQRFRGRTDWGLLVLLLGAAAYLAWDFTSGGHASRWILDGYTRRGFSLEERLLTQPKVVLFHLSQIVWPAPERFAIEHDVAIVRSAADWHFWAPLSVIVGWCLAAGFAAARNHGHAAFFMLWVPVTLAIESSVVPLEMVFEHRMYLPAIGLAGLIALGVRRLCACSDSKRIVVSALLVSIITYSAWSTYVRVPQWRNEATLYAQAVKLAPNSSRAWNHLGIALLQQRRGERISAEQSERAMQALQRAMDLDPTYPAPWTNRGVARYLNGDLLGALSDFRRAIALSPREAAAQHYLGEIYATLGQHDHARIARKRACALGVSQDCLHR